MHLCYFGLGTYYIFWIYLDKSLRLVVRKNVLELKRCVDAHVSSLWFDEGLSESCPEGGVKTLVGMRCLAAGLAEQHVDISDHASVDVRGQGSDQRRLGAMLNNLNVLGKPSVQIRSQTARLFLRLSCDFAVVLVSPVDSEEGAFGVRPTIRVPIG